MLISLCCWGDTLTVNPAGTAGRIAGDAVIGGTLTPESAGDAWQYWQDQGGTAGQDFMRGYITTGAATWW